ncbi:MAG: helix-turn-helix domain-containing protein [Bacteroidota bacterium]
MDDPQKAKRLEAAGWKVGDASDFLVLSPEEAELVAFKLALANRVRELRIGKSWTQLQLAKAIGSSQSRIAKLEAADPSVSTDFMLKAFFMLGSRSGDIKTVIAPAKARRKKLYRKSLERAR